MTLEECLAQAICAAYWRTAELPMTWATSGQLQRDVWRLCARDAIAADKQFKATQPPPQLTAGDKNGTS